MSSKHRTPPRSTQTSYDSTTTESLNEKLTKATDLESTLDKLKLKRSSDSEAKSSAIRLELCSLFSDLIIVDPPLAAANNIIERLWKHCFYGRINELRSRITKEKSRAKKRSAASPGSVSNAAEVEKQLQQFLKEAVALYQYLIKKYSEALTDSTQQDAEYVESIISSLYRMHIHLGDLYRYSCNTQNAEECYLKSAKFAPGTGNPFNQLAVVAQNQESQTVLALYYYARSLMALQPFETSRPNLVRLFETNSKWLGDHSRGESHKVLVGNKDWVHKQKTVMTRTVMAKLVELQYMFFKGISLEDGDEKVDLNRVMEGMEEQIKGFEELLSVTGCSEGLLCKIVAILAFSTLGAGNMGKLCGGEQLRGLEASTLRGVVMNNQAIAFSFLLRFLALLAENVVKFIEEKGLTGSGKKGLGGVRPLSSLLLGVKFATSIYAGSKWFQGLPLYPLKQTVEQVDTSPIRDLCKKSHCSFWESVAKVSNCFKGLDLVWMDGPSPPECIDVFSDYICYIPFDSFLTRTSDSTSKYASLEEAVSALSTKSKSTSKTDDEEAITKVRLLLGVASQATRPVESDGTGTYFLVEDADSKTLRALCEEDVAPKTNVADMLLDNTDFDADLDEPEEKSNYSNLDVPLLTPAALLASAAAAEPPAPEAAKPSTMNGLVPTLTIAPENNSATKPFPPPPGFGPPRNANQTSAPNVNPSPPPVDNPLLLSLLPQTKQPSMQPNTFGSNFGGSLVNNGSTSTGTINMPQAGLSLYNTLNPFAAEQPASKMSSFGGLDLSLGGGNLLNAGQPSTNTRIMPQAGPNIFDTLNPFATEQPTSPPTSGGLDLNFMLNNAQRKNPPGFTDPQRTESMESDPFNHNDSLLKFLFDSNVSED